MAEKTEKVHTKKLAAMVTIIDEKGDAAMTEKVRDEFNKALGSFIERMGKKYGLGMTHDYARLVEYRNDKDRFGWVGRKAKISLQVVEG